MTAPRAFHIGDILSVLTHLLVSPNGISGVHQLLDHMTGDQLMTHQLPRANDECELSLREQFPDLAAVTTPETWPDGDRKTVVMAWLDQVAHGTTRLVTPLAPEDHTQIHPLAEIAMMTKEARA